MSVYEAENNLLLVARIIAKEVCPDITEKDLNKIQLRYTNAGCSLNVGFIMSKYLDKTPLECAEYFSEIYVLLRDKWNNDQDS